MENTDSYDRQITNHEIFAILKSADPDNLITHRHYQEFIWNVGDKPCRTQDHGKCMHSQKFYCRQNPLERAYRRKIKNYGFMTKGAYLHECAEIIAFNTVLANE